MNDKTRAALNVLAKSFVRFAGHQNVAGLNDFAASVQTFVSVWTAEPSEPPGSDDLQTNGA